MKYTIHGFSQEIALGFRKELETNGKKTIIKLDCTDLLLLRWFVDFFPKMKKTNVNGKEYAWVNYSTVIEELPLLGISKQSVYLHFSKMVEFGILEHKHIKEGGSYSYYAFGINYEALISTSGSIKNYEGVNKKLLGGSIKNYEWVNKKLLNKDPSTNNPSTSNPSTSNKENKKESINYQAIVNAYNETCVSLPSIQKLTDKRKNKIKARLKSFTIDDFNKLFKKVQESKFLNGDNDKGWRANFDWLIEESNMLKVLEGYYEDRKSKQSISEKYKQIDEAYYEEWD